MVGMLSIFWQHVVMVSISGVFGVAASAAGALLNRKVGRIEKALNGRMDALQADLAEGGGKT